jgi:hypothetical protein
MNPAWAFELNLNPSVPEATRAALYADYMRDALFEHASIASFSVFTMELLAVGAPPELVYDAQQAALDEVDHARITFAIASVFAGRMAGPGPLALGDVAPKTDLSTIAAQAVREGCIGETIASLIAAAQAECAEHLHLEIALRKIADDEARHAELAWRFVRWALATDPSIAPAVKAAFEMTPPVPPRVPPVDTAAWRACGRLLEKEYASIVRDALNEVIGPCSRALLSSS